MKVKVTYRETRHFTAEVEVGTAEINGDTPTESEVVALFTKAFLFFENKEELTKVTK